MSVSIRRLGRFLAIGCVLGAPLATHLALVTGHGTVLAGSLVALQVVLVSWAALSLAAPAAARRHPAGWRLVRLAICTLAGGLTAAAWHDNGNAMMLAAAVPHAIVFAGLLVLFATSLAPGREAIITRVARWSRGVLSAELVGYTRRVTVVWCCFFAAQLGASALLGVLAPPPWWSGFINLGTVPLVALMFGSELAYRHWRHGIHRSALPEGRMGRILQVIGQIRAPFRQAGP